MMFIKYRNHVNSIGSCKQLFYNGFVVMYPGRCSNVAL